MALEQFLLLFYSDRVSQRSDDAVIGKVLPVVKLPPMLLNGSMDCQGRINATQRCQVIGLCVHFTNYVELISDRNPLLPAAMDQNGLYST
jgi:hypothetical protein